MKKISTVSIILIAIAAIVLFAIIFAVSAYNGLVSENQSVLNQQANVETMLQRRSDLIPNLVNTVKGFASHEQQAIDSVTEARAKLAGANSFEEKTAANADISNALSRLLVVVENYPNLKANENFIQLSDELAGTENRISTARRDYNEAVTTFNTKIKKFPTNIIASMFGFSEYTFFKADDDAQTAPVVDFN